MCPSKMRSAPRPITSPKACCWPSIRNRDGARPRSPNRSRPRGSRRLCSNSRGSKSLNIWDGRSSNSPNRSSKSPKLSAVAAHGEPRIELAAFGNHHPELTVGEVDRNLLERTECIHPEQQCRRLVELQLLEGVRVGENDSKVLQRDPADVELAHEHIVAGNLSPGD